GLWYDDPKELPTTARRGSGPRARTTLSNTTVLRTLFDDLLVKTLVEDGRTGRDEPRAPIDLAILAWLGEVRRRELSAARGPRVPRLQDRCHSGVTPYVVRGWVVPEDLAGWVEYPRRLEAYDARKSSQVDAWIAQALQELKDGAPGRALF